MKVNELRIGSYVESFGQPLRVDIIDKIVINGVEVGLYKPIPITEQWLKDFKFKKLSITGYVITGATYWKKDGIVIYRNGDKYYVPIGEKVGGELGRTVIEFDKVHELQNIFALTGKELTK